MASALKLTAPLDEDGINIRFPDEITASTYEIIADGALLSAGSLLREIAFPPHTLVVMVKRDDRYLVPTGNTRIHLGDRLFIVSEGVDNTPTK